MADMASQEILDNLYTREFILQNERWFGENYSSASREAATKVMNLWINTGIQKYLYKFTQYQQGYILYELNAITNDFIY